MGPVNSMFGNMILISDATGTGARNIVQRDSGLMPRKCSQEVRASFSWTVPSYESADQHPECTATSPNISNIQNILKFGRCRTLTCNLHPTDLLGCQHHWLCGLGGPRPTGPWEFFPRDAPRISKVNYIYGVYIYISIYLSISYISISYICVCGWVVAVRVAGSSGVLGAQGTWMAAASAKS